MQWATPEDPCQLSVITGGTAPCIGIGHVLSITFVEVAQHEAGSWIFPCSERLTEMTALHIVIGVQRLKLPLPKVMSLNTLR